MRHSALVFFVTVIFGVFAAEARYKRKFDSDFVFAEESDTKDESKSVTGKKKWIHDPDSDLCVPLKCKKKELCLLENLYTAVCVSKKELHKNGDIIMSKSRYLAEEAKKKAVFKEDDLDDDDDDDDDDDLDDDEDDDDDIFYDNSPSSNVENNLNDVGSQKCTPCPIMKPVFLCGSDNRTYSSICRLDYHNCVHRTSVKATCKGFCPCKEAKDQSSSANKNKYVAEKQKKDPQVDRVSDVYALTPEDFKYENKLYKYIRYSKNADAENLKKKYYNRMKTSTPDYQEKDGYRGENDVSDDKPAPVKPNKKKECSEAALKSMGNRLLDWFSVIKAENRRRPEYKGKDIVSFGCKPEVIWMFKHLDLDADGQLTLQELYDLEHDQNEHCIKPFLDMCDTNRDIFVSPYEWCYCFMKSERPCAAVRKRIPQHIMTGVYVPTCDSEGYYEPMQCHSATGMCWCVNKHGVEFANSKTHGKVDCDLYFIKAGATEKTTSPEVNNKSNNDVENSMNKKIDSNNSDDDDDDSDDDDDFDGSGDQPLEF